MSRLGVNTRWARVGGWVAITGVAAFLLVVVALHVVQVGYDPSTQLMSELAQGPHGGFMIIAFAGLAAAMTGIQVAIGALGGAIAFRVLMVGAALAFLAAGIFPLGKTSEIHIAAIAAAFVLSGLVMYLLPSTQGGRGFIPRFASWALAIGLAVSIALGQSVLPMALAQRTASFFLLAWFAVVGWRLTRFR